MDVHQELAKIEIQQEMARATTYVDKSEDSAWMSIAERLAKVKEMFRVLEKEEAQLISALKALCNGMSCRGGRFIYEKSFRKGSIRYADIPYLQSVDLEQFRNKDVEIWKLDLVLGNHNN